jgi:hypothetical protein
MATVAKSGWHSSKLHLALIAITILTFVFVFVVAKTGEPAGFGEYCIALVSLVGTYSGSRVAESFAQRSSVKVSSGADTISTDSRGPS